VDAALGQQGQQGAAVPGGDMSAALAGQDFEERPGSRADVIWCSGRQHRLVTIAFLPTDHVR
jgi:hypothetical protein